MYLGKQQFASISGTFLAWEFELKDDQGGTLALIDRNFQVSDCCLFVCVCACMLLIPCLAALNQLKQTDENHID